MASVECLLSPDNQVVVAQENEASRCFQSPYSEDAQDDDESAEPELSWRLDPKRSLSDWTITVYIQGRLYHEIYYVHKSVLAVGPRRSLYFAAAFQNRDPHGELDDNFGSTFDDSFVQAPVQKMPPPTQHIDLDKANCSLELEELAAESFPVLLDFLYSGELAVATHNVTALNALAERLQIKLLRRRIRDFWTQDLTMETVCIYYEHARVFGDNRILAHAEIYCAEHLFEIREHAVIELLTTVDPLFFLHVITHPALTGASLRLSLLVAVYCNIHKEELDAERFCELTGPLHLPVLEVKAAKALLELEDELCGRDPGLPLSSLKARCIEVLSTHWKEACLTDNDQVHLPRLFGASLESFVSHSLVNAKTRLDRSEEERHALQRRNDDLSRQVAAMNAKLDQLTLQAQRRKMDSSSRQQETSNTKKDASPTSIVWTKE